LNGLGNILYLVHRLPYPPNKGDKVRSYHLLKHLVRQHRVFLGTFVDDPADEQYLDTVRGLCADLHAARLDPRIAKIKSLRGLFSGEALTLPYYRDAGLQAWVDRTMGEQGIDAAVIFSGAMAQYLCLQNSAGGHAVGYGETNRAVREMPDSEIANTSEAKQSRRPEASTASGSPRRYAPRDDGIFQGLTSFSGAGSLRPCGSRDDVIARRHSRRGNPAANATSDGFPVLVDFVDVDSAKWTQYAPNHRWPMSWLYRREGERLLAFERQVAAAATQSFFVTDNEAELFRRQAPECAGRVEAIENGVDSEQFSPDHDLPSPYPSTGKAVVFTGAMDYWPNVDAVTWFAAEVLPILRAKWPDLTFYIVGRSPAPAVQALAGEGVAVTGTVPDVRPYLRHADAVVAPLRVARGIQNKILEAMAMARPVVASASCAGAIEARLDEELLTAETAEEFANAVEILLADPARADAIGQAARQQVVGRYSWDANLAGIDRHLGIGDAGVPIS
jgi:sugar transferase (PEP-CTERM/EpsH1 system associated)